MLIASFSAFADDTVAQSPTPVVIMPKSGKIVIPIGSPVVFTIAGIDDKVTVDLNGLTETLSQSVALDAPTNITFQLAKTAGKNFNSGHHILTVKAGDSITTAEYDVSVVVDPTKLATANQKVGCIGPSVVDAGVMFTPYNWLFAQGGSSNEYRWTSTEGIVFSLTFPNSIGPVAQTMGYYPTSDGPKTVLVENGGEYGVCNFTVVNSDKAPYRRFFR